MHRKFKLAVFVLALLPSLAIAQSTLPGWSEKREAPKGFVFSLAPESITVQANTPNWVELRFRIVEGMHINSHTPLDNNLIPTALSAEDGSEIKLLDANYPQGVKLTLKSANEEMLSVYSGDFVVRAKLAAPSGSHILKLKLRYQACTMNACMPPKTLPFKILLDAH